MNKLEKTALGAEVCGLAARGAEMVRGIDDPLAPYLAAMKLVGIDAETAAKVTAIAEMIKEQR